MVETIPSATAILFGDQTLSYSELDTRSHSLARAILAAAPDEPIVAISTTRNIEMIIGALAILRSGKAYLPLDPAYPEDRLRQITADSRITLVLSPREESAFFRNLGLTTLDTAGQYPADPTGQITPPAGLAYVLYTSGSTGTPKGVCMGHSPLVNLLQWQEKHSTAGIGTRTLQFAPLSFDVSFQEIFATLSTGGTLIMITDDLRLDPKSLLHYIEDNRINRLFLPFVALQFLTESADAERFYPSSLTEVMTAGEQLKITPQVKRFFSALPGCILLNQYGPTECHVVTELRLDGDPDAWPALPSIGKPIDNTQILIIDDQGLLLPAGETGELCIAGACLAEGYLRRPELTAEKFIDWQHPALGPVRIYRTGDLARYVPDGNIDYLGRRDHQVKIRGYRIELGEIEVLLNEQPGILQAVVIAREDVPGQKKLVAYLVSADGKKDLGPIRQAVSRHLPDYMMPSAFVWLDAFPKTTSGKVDRKQLPKPEIKRPDLATPYAKPVSTAEQQLATLWASLLQLDRVGRNDNFFEIGGNSLLALKTVAAVGTEFSWTLPITKIYQFPTVAGIAGWLEGGVRSALRQTAPKRASINAEKAVAVIGMAGRFPGAADVEKLWHLLKNGREAISFFPPEELHPSLPASEKDDPAYVPARGILDDAAAFDAAYFGINPRMAELMDPQQRIFLETAVAALEHGGYGPGTYNGSIGVFAGSGNNSYYLNNVLQRRDLVDKVGAFQVMTYNEKDYVASRTSFLLDLQGPAVSVHSGCSTSLLAVAQAVQSLRDGQCDMALAGGAAVTAPIKSGHIYQEGAMLSKDGHCRPFDARAQGTLFSDGAGIVLLKPLEAALRDGDTIYALVKGIGVNNDGGAKGSFTAPSAEGQAGAIRMAIDDAGVPPETISYVEAHGTATPLGDPIEIEGLTMAFGQTDQRGYCALGSIKSNFGHLTAAAGVAGMIKTILALRHKQIPASLHFERPNPNIDFAKTPFFVNTSLRDWTSNGPRRAGVSSFGVGGTNVHLVLEEGPEDQAVKTPGRPTQLIAWSAHIPGSAQAWSKNLVDWLETHPETDLADLAYTLRTARKDSKIRQYIVANDITELKKKIRSTDPYPANTLHEAATHLVFMFPGQGSQYVNMGADCYALEPAFREAVDDCAAILQSILQTDIRSVLYPAVNATGQGADINNTFYTQPALFVVEYALARLWMSWGIQPTALVGHSVGEFVAAHLAGVFSLEDALKLVAARGRLMASLPAGDMIAVQTGYEAVTPLLTPELAIATVNSPGSCVVSGPSPAIASLTARLEARDISVRQLYTSHAFHSPMMDPIVEPFEAVVNSIKLDIPRIPVASTVTATWMSDSQATDARYWASHVRATVRFSDALRFLIDNDHRLMLEVGPRAVATGLARRHIVTPPVISVASLHPQEYGSDHRSLLNALGQLWLNGIRPDWNAYFSNEKRHKLALPAYAFENTHYWVDPVVGQPQLSTQITASTQTPSTIQTSSTPMRKELLIEKVRDILQDASGIDLGSSNPGMSFIEMGMDSLLLTQVALNLKKEFGLPVTFRQLNDEYGSLDQLAAYLDANLPADKFAPAATQPTQPVFAAAPVQPHFAPTPSQPQNWTSTLQAPPTGNDTLVGLIAHQIQLLAQQVSLLQGGNGQISRPVQNLSSGAPGLLPKEAAAAIPGFKPSPTAEAGLTKSPASDAGGPKSPTAEAGLTTEEVVELKKPFGASARIEKHATNLSSTQQAFLADLTMRYNRKTAGSKSYTARHRSYMADPRVVSGFRPLTKELVYPIVVNQSKGSRIWDIDGNEYIDALNGFGSNMLGYQPEIIRSAVAAQLEKGYELGPQHELAGPVCKLICEFTNFDRAALCNTGSEAVLGAMRIARTVTGRSMIVAFTGSYHGIVDEVIVRGTKKLRSFPAAPGIMPEAVQNMLILEYGTEESLRIITERANDLAAVLVEPVQSRRPEFQPVEFLRKLRDITTASGTALIFDEVITGFRMHPGGAQALFGVKADLGTYGKVVAGGMPIGVIAGNSAYMDALDGGDWQYGNESTPEAGVTYFAGTFVRHPLALAASMASLEYMKKKGPALQQALTQKAGRLADGINEVCKHLGLPCYAAQFGSLWKLKWKEELPYTELIFTLMREKGIHIWDGFPCFVTEAHTNEEVDTIIAKFKESVEEMVVAGFLPSTTKQTGATGKMIEETPPSNGARIGKDPQGNPAWFIADPDRPGKYLQLN